MGWIRSWVKGTGTPVPLTGVRSLDEVGTGRNKLRKGKSPNEDRSPVKIDPGLLEPEPELGQNWSGVGLFLLTRPSGVSSAPGASSAALIWCCEAKTITRHEASGGGSWVLSRTNGLRAMSTSDGGKYSLI
ncbi:hypothetical protein FB45DRAFT_1006658 [Roridomyces roridus]|uniref:Uncharacterized protein n=1 Tax=Roridomyces roridus TaxID=1738132 RepID=A0AAD7FHZ8_9AGAR|nr:hypothetical protein FB45DRAFT_1006658 [Roridomyces roridus]